MWYAVWKNQQGRVCGFITGDYEMPKEWESEEAALEEMKGHVLEHYTEYVEL